ncbi:hypothetical protein HOY82DRAFT_567497 [Tuber indicum]|nr:hypothetical protein HOY82DRAFT_567497 [Tuber indicum]
MLKAKITISLEMQFRILAGSPNISDSIMTVIIFFTLVQLRVRSKPQLKTQIMPFSYRGKLLCNSRPCV